MEKLNLLYFRTKNEFPKTLLYSLFVEVPVFYNLLLFNSRGLVISALDKSTTN